MSRRQRTARETAQRLRVARDKAQRRRARTRRAVSVAAAVTLAGTGATAAVAASPAAQQQIRSSLLDCSGATTPSSSPENLTAVGGDLYFTAYDGEHGQGLWRTDGSAAGTVLLKEFGPTGYGYYDDYSSGAGDLVDVDGTLFFTVDGDEGDELWRSDGTPAGTVRVKGFDDVGNGYDDGGALTAVGDSLFFVADDGVHGDELWRSDGTRSGTVLVKDIGDGSGDGYDYYSNGPSYLTAAGGTLFFAADDGTHGQELWRSDGTKAGTVMVRNIRPASYSSQLRSLTAVGDALFFTARDGEHGRELWTSDGTKDGTALVKDIRTGGATGTSGPLVGVDDGTVFFPASDDADGRDLWRSDGTTAGTVLVKDFSNGSDEEDYDGLGYMAGVGDTLFFAASDDTHGIELWRSDGTESGTVMVKDIRPGDYDGYPTRFAAVGDELFFVARDGVHGPELWHSDGTAAGTSMVEDIDPDADGRSPRQLTAAGGLVYFTADDGTHGTELWRSDGTADGTDLVDDINTGGAFVVAERGRADTDKGTLTVRAATDGPGTFSLARNRLLRGWSREVTGDSDEGIAFRVTLEPTRRAKRILRRDGEVRVRAEFTFTSCGGAVNTKTQRYTLKMR